MKKSLLIIVGSLNMGGVETYTVRLAKYLSQYIQIKILIMSKKHNDELLEEVSKYAAIYFLHNYMTPNFLGKYNYLNRIPFLLPVNHSQLVVDLGDTNYIHATNSESLVLANNVLKYDNKIRISLGIYNSKEFVWSTNTYFRSIEKSMFLSINYKNILSPNESSLSILQSCYNKKFTSPVIPIGIEMPNMAEDIFNPNSNKIVSIGRLVKFKSYNEHIINIIDEINKIHGTAYEYHIYGYGPNETKLKEISSTKKSKIVFHGILDYSKMKDILSDCIIFVGSGTAIIESSSFGIPSIIGIESDKQLKTYGLFSDLIGFSYNEDNLLINKIKIIDEINKFLKLDITQKKKISNAHIKKAQQFSIDKVSKLFITALDNLHVNQYFTYNIFKYKISYFLWLIKNKLNITHEMRDRRG